MTQLDTVRIRAKYNHLAKRIFHGVVWRGNPQCQENKNAGKDVHFEHVQRRVG